MSDFGNDDKWQKQMRDRYLVHFYQKYSQDGRYVFLDRKSGCTVTLQKLGIDTVFHSVRTGESICIDEKIVRRAYDSFALETVSNTFSGKAGWMQDGQADYLSYAFARTDGGLLVYVIDFPKLRKWFWPVHGSYYYHEMLDTGNCTGMRLVPIADVENNVDAWKYICTDDGCIPDIDNNDSLWSIWPG